MSTKTAGPTKKPKTKKPKEMRGWGWFPNSAAMRAVCREAVEARMREVGDKYIMRLGLPRKVAKP